MAKKEPEVDSVLTALTDAHDAIATLAGLKTLLVKQDFPNDVAAEMVLEILKSGNLANEKELRSHE